MFLCETITKLISKLQPEYIALYTLCSILIYLLQALLSDSLTLDSLFLMAPSDLEQMLVKHDINPEDGRQLTMCLDHLNSFYGEQVSLFLSLFLPSTPSLISTSSLSFVKITVVSHEVEHIIKQFSCFYTWT